MNLVLQTITKYLSNGRKVNFQSSKMQVLLMLFNKRHYQGDRFPVSYASWNNAKQQTPNHFNTKQQPVY